MMAAAWILAVALGGGVQGMQAGPPPPPPPAMPPRPENPRGTAVVRGRVTSAATGRPLRRAAIRFTAEGGRGDWRTSTDVAGEYELAALPAGRYTVTVTRSGHLQTQHGQPRYGEPGTPLDIADGQKLDRLDFALQRAGMASGRITDDSGEPVVGVQVHPMVYQFYEGRRALVPAAGTAHTDDTGHFRLPGLPPGEYVLSARSRETWAGDQDPKRTFAFAPSYYPGTARAEEAQRVRIGPGQEVSQLDFRLVEAPTATLSGTATSQDGTPLANAAVALTAEIMGPGGGTMSIVGQARSLPDGSWRIPNVPPGEFVLRVTGMGGDGAPETAQQRLTVAGADLEDLALRTDGGAIVSGQVIAETGALPTTGAALRVYTQRVEPDRRAARPGPNDGTVKADGFFSYLSSSGEVYVRVMGLPPGWAVKQVEAGGRDVTDAPLSVRGGRPLSGVRVTVSNRFATVSGRLSDDKGGAAAGVVLLYPADAEKWPLAGARTTRADASGAFRFNTVKPGEYLIVALESVLGWQAADPEFLDAQRSRARRIDVIGAEPESVNLEVIR